MKKKRFLWTSSCIILSFGYIIPIAYGSTPFQPAQEGDYPEPKRALTASQFMRGKEGLKTFSWSGKNEEKLEEMSIGKIKEEELQDPSLSPDHVQELAPQKGITISQLLCAKDLLKPLPEEVSEEVSQTSSSGPQGFIITPQMLLKGKNTLVEVTEPQKNVFKENHFENKILFGEKPDSDQMKRAKLKKAIEKGQELRDHSAEVKLPYNPKDLVEERDSFFKERFLTQDLDRLEKIQEELEEIKGKINTLNNSKDKNSLPQARLVLQGAEEIQKLLEKPKRNPMETLDLETLCEKVGFISVSGPLTKEIFKPFLIQNQEKVAYLQSTLSSLQEKVRTLENEKKDLQKKKTKAQERWKNFLSYLKHLGEKRTISEIPKEEKETYYKMYMDPGMSLITPEKGWGFMKRQELEKAFAPQAQKREREEKIEEGWDDSIPLSTSLKEENEGLLSASPESSLSLLAQGEGEPQPAMDPISPRVPNEECPESGSASQNSEGPNGLSEGLENSKTSSEQSPLSPSPQTRNWLRWIWGSKGN